MLSPILFDNWITATLTAVNPTHLVQSHISLENGLLRLGRYSWPLSNGRIFLVAAGKAAVAMSQPLLTLLSDKLSGGVIISKKESPPANLPAAIQFFQGGHPAPTEASVAAATAVTHLLHGTTADDLVICLISGGASALMSRPRISLANWQALNQALLVSGCAIQQFNAVRQQLDELKGGGLAWLAAPAICVSLILSDVVGNPLDKIGSGPTAPPAASPAEARAILSRYDLPSKLSKPVWRAVVAALEDSPADSLPDSPRHYEIIGDVRVAAQALTAAVSQAGFTARLLTTHLEGEAREAGKIAAALAKDLAPGEALILGGETTVTLRGDGRGGRNQELALSAAIGLEGYPDRLILTLATDGEDGPTPAAGAWITGDTVSRARDMGMDATVYLDNNDSYTFFAQAGGLLEIGPTGTNVNDLLLILRRDA